VAAGAGRDYHGQRRDRKPIHRGRRTIVEIKNLGAVPLADDLEQVVDGRLVPLPDDGAVTIRGGEVFVSHPKDNGAS
jgi:hypothetical protein